ncbi:MAG TPA: lysophospholipid acyltransferase family protein [Bacteroidota bacterium]
MALAGSLLFWAFMLVTSVLLFPVALLIRGVTSPFDRRLAFLHLFSCFWASLYTWCNPLWSVRIDGKDHMDRNATYVMVCNHQSLVDILVLFRLFVHFKWVSKAENFRIPFVGWNMTLNRYIRIERGRLRGNLSMMRGAEAALEAGSSVMIFPEGTRSPGGVLGGFKAGAFELALRTGRPILPIVIDGTAAALPKKGFILRGKQAICIRVLKPISPPWAPGTDAGALSAMAHGRIAGEPG